MFGSSSKRERSDEQHIPTLLTEKREAEAKQLKDWNPAYRKQEADAKHQKHLDPHQRQKEASAKSFQALITENRMQKAKQVKLIGKMLTENLEADG